MAKQVHVFTFDGVNTVLDVGSGSLHRVDDLAAAILRLGDLELPELMPRLADRFPAEEIREVWEEIQILKAEGTLWAEEPADPGGAPEPVVKSLCLNVAHDCNLTCDYCFAGQGDFGGARGLMSAAVAKKALDFLIQSSGSRHNLEVDFFGGEPLLNLEVVKEALAYGREQAALHGKEISFTLTTNGLLLTPEIEQFLNDEGLSLVLSLDGRAETHDRFRRDRGGKGTYERLVPRFQTVVAGRGNTDYYVRGTYSRFNLDFSRDVAHLWDLGFKEVSVEPVVAGPEAAYALRPEDLPMLTREYESLARELARRRRAGEDIRFFHFEVEMEEGPCLEKRLKGCGAGVEYLAVDPAGDLYPCHQFVGQSDLRLGDVEVGLERPDLRKLFSEVRPGVKEDCRDCWARYHCGGGCHANAYLQEGDLRQPWRLGCELERKRLELALYLQVLATEPMAE